MQLRQSLINYCLKDNKKNCINVLVLKRKDEVDHVIKSDILYITAPKPSQPVIFIWFLIPWFLLCNYDNVILKYYYYTFIFLSETFNVRADRSVCFIQMSPVHIRCFFSRHSNAKFPHPRSLCRGSQAYRSPVSASRLMPTHLSFIRIPLKVDISIDIFTALICLSVLSTESQYRQCINNTL